MVAWEYTPGVQVGDGGSVSGDARLTLGVTNGTYCGRLTVTTVTGS